VLGALGIQHLVRMRHNVICGLFGSAVFFNSLKQQDFRRKVTEYKFRVLIFCQILSATFLILRRNERDVIKNVYLS
jgi:hypothetical protein